LTANPFLLSVDIGGTHTRMAVFELVAKHPVLHHSERYLSGEYSGFTEIAKNFLATWTGPKICGMAIGVAGPVTETSVRLTNLNWTLSTTEIAKDLKIEQVFLLNDLTAHAYGLKQLAGKDFSTLQKGHEKSGNQCIVAAGTGLGEAVMFYHQGENWPSHSEGGHADFGPANEMDDELLTFLRAEYGHVSWERIVSGRLGFPNLYNFMTRKRGMKPVPEIEEARKQGGDISPVLLAAGNDGNETAVAIIKTFCRLYGAEAGNLALKTMAIGGVFVLGGVSRAYAKWLEGPEFKAAFADKGRFSELMTTIPIKLVLAQGNGLRGSAIYGFSRILACRPT